MTTYDEENRAEIENLRLQGSTVPLLVADHLMEEVLTHAAKLNTTWQAAMRDLMRRGLRENPANSAAGTKAEGVPVSDSVPPVGDVAQSPIPRAGPNRRLYAGDGFELDGDTGLKNLLICERAEQGDYRCSNICHPGKRWCLDCYVAYQDGHGTGNSANNRQAYLNTAAANAPEYMPYPTPAPDWLDPAWRERMLAMVSDP